MPYCINCGVKLGDTDEKCPLCQTKVYNPDLNFKADGKPPFPVNNIKEPKMNPKYKVIIAALAFLLAAALSLICDYSLNQSIIWSGFAAGAIIIILCDVFIPMILTNKNIFFYLIIDFTVILVYLKYIEYKTNGNWFLSFSLPVMISIMVIISAALMLKRFTNFTNLLIFAISFILTGFECIFLEFLISINFTNQSHFIWSYYPLATFIVLGIILIIIDKNHKINEKVKKSFFI